MYIKPIDDSKFEVFQKQKNGTKLYLEKTDDTVLDFCFMVGKKKYVVARFSKALPGDGIMSWLEYKKRTNTM